MLQCFSIEVIGVTNYQSNLPMHPSPSKASSRRTVKPWSIPFPAPISTRPRYNHAGVELLNLITERIPFHFIDSYCRSASTYYPEKKTT